MRTREARKQKNIYDRLFEHTHEQQPLAWHKFPERSVESFFFMSERDPWMVLIAVDR